MEKSRIAFRSVTAGAVVALALMLFLSSSVRNLYMVAEQGGALADDVTVWMTMTIVWVFSVFAGCVLSAMASRAREVEDGVLQGITVWAISYIGLGVLISVRAAGFDPVVDVDQISTFWVVRDFSGEVTSLIGAVVGGVLGVRWESPKAIGNGQNVSTASRVVPT